MFHIRHVVGGALEDDPPQSSIHSFCQRMLTASLDFLLSRLVVLIFWEYIWMVVGHTTLLGSIYYIYFANPECNLNKLLTYPICRFI